MTSEQYRTIADWKVDVDIYVCDRSLEGIVAAPRHQHPLAERWGEDCAEPDCIYRMAPLRLFGDVREPFLAHVTDQARAIGRRPASFVDDVMLDLWSVSTRRPIRIGYLAGSWIAERVALRPAALRGAALCSLQCEVVRTIKDLLGVDALQLPAPNHDRGHYHVVHPNAWDALDWRSLGSLQEANGLDGTPK